VIEKVSQITNYIILSLFLTQAPLAYAGSWDQDCLDTEKIEQKSCDATPANTWAHDLRDKVINDKNFQDQEVNDFFYDFMQDQKKQTACEEHMLNTIDLFPNTKGQWTSGDLKIKNSAGAVLQKQILTSVYKAIPDLANLAWNCENEQKTLESLKDGIRMSNAMTGDTGPKVIPETAPIVQEQQRSVAKACEKYESKIGGLWSGGSPEMNSYIKKWVRRYQNTHQKGWMNEHQFLSEALPVDGAGYYSGESSDGQANRNQNLNFQSLVIENMEKKAQDRSAYLLQNENFAQRSSVREEMMKDGGGAALAALPRLAKGKYSAFGKGLSCQIMSDYWDRPRLHKKILDGGLVLLGGVSVVLTGGATSELEGVAVAACIADTTTAILAGSQLPQACSGELEAGSLQAAPICEQFKNLNPGEMPPSSLTETLDARASCGETIFNTALAVTGAVGTGIKTVKTAKTARTLASSGEDASAVATTTNAAAEKATESLNTSRVKQAMTEVNPNRSTVDDAILKEAQKAEQHGQLALSHLTPDAEGGVLAQLKGPEELQAIDAAAAKHPDEYQKILKEHPCLTRDGHTSLNVVSKFFAFLEISLVEEVEAAAFGCSISELGQFTEELRRFAGLDNLDLRANDWVTVMGPDGRTMSNGQIVHFEGDTAVVRVFNPDGSPAVPLHVPYWDLGHYYEMSVTEKIPLEAYRTSAPGTRVSYTSSSGNQYTGYYVAETKDRIFYKESTDPNSPVIALWRNRLNGAAQNLEKTAIRTPEAALQIQSHSGQVQSPPDGNSLRISGGGNGSFQGTENGRAFSAETYSGLPKAGVAPANNINEDSVLVSKTKHGSTVFTSIDGMGGMGDGHIASDATARHIEKELSHGKTMDQALDGVPQAIRDSGTREGGGVVLVSAELKGNQLTFRNVGDAKAFVSRNGSVIAETTPNTRAGDDWLYWNRKGRAESAATYRSQGLSESQINQRLSDTDNRLYAEVNRPGANPNNAYQGSRKHYKWA